MKLIFIKLFKPKKSTLGILIFVFLAIHSGTSHLGPAISGARLATAIFITAIVYIISVLIKFFKWARQEYPISGQSNHTKPSKSDSDDLPK